MSLHSTIAAYSIADTLSHPANCLLPHTFLCCIRIIINHHQRRHSHSCSHRARTHSTIIQSSRPTLTCSFTNRFEKIACGSTRTFLTDRSLIEDFVQLTPTWEDIQQILDLYYTTKAPLQGRDSNVGYTFITADYHVAPVLPPKINCTCQAAMDAYASLLSVVSKTPTPGAPVTLDPEVLNTGTSKIVATLRAYQDPTYSIPASSVTNMPIVVTRFYLEVSTKFTRNRITISDCQASNIENLLNDTSSLKVRMNYCDNLRGRNIKKLYSVMRTLCNSISRGGVVVVVLKGEVEGEEAGGGDEETVEVGRQDLSETLFECMSDTKVGLIT